MAAKAREIKCRSAPSTPLSSQRKKTKSLDANSTSQDPKPVPNYLRPTISSSKPSSKQEYAPMPTTTTKKAPIDKANSSPLRKLNPHPLPKPAISPTKSKTPPIKNSKAPPLPAKNRSISKGTTTNIKKHETPASPPSRPIMPEEEVLSVDIESQTNREKGIDPPSPKKEEEPSLHYEASEESMCGCDEATSDDGEVRDLKKFQQEKELIIENVKEKDEEETSAVMNKKGAIQEKDSPKAYNEVIEETASKLAERRNKVRALAGAFETVISLQEPKGQPIQPKDEEIVNNGKTSQESKQKEIGQPDQQNTGVDADMEAEQQSRPQEGKLEEGLTASAETGEKDDLDVIESREEGGKAIEEITKEKSNATEEAIEEKSNATIVSVEEKDDDPKDSHSAI